MLFMAVGGYMLFMGVGYGDWGTAVITNIYYYHSTAHPTEWTATPTPTKQQTQTGLK